MAHPPNAVFLPYSPNVLEEVFWEVRQKFTADSSLLARIEQLTPPREAGASLK
jgi:hypothetical protein